MNARSIALDILIKYRKENTYLNIELKHALTDEFSKEDKSFITRVVYGTVQYQLYLDYLLKPYVKKVKDFEYMLLLMSIYQHEFMDSLPDYAIVNEAVEIAKKKSKFSANFVNAVLKNVFSNKPNFDGLDELEVLSIQTSHPLWLVKMFNKQYGYDTTVKILNANNEDPIQIARLNTLKCDAASLLQDANFSKFDLGNSSYQYKGGNIASTKAFKQGFVTIQDASSQLVVELLNPNINAKVLDMCSAPGSKTTHIAQIMNNTGSIDAYDLYQHKVNLINKQCERLGVTNVHAYAYDSTKLIEKYAEESFDYILLDAPCSGLGVLSRKPEIRYHKSNAMDEIITIQKQLLENSYKLLKKDSIMVYSTCTLNKKENSKQIEMFTTLHPDMEVIEERTVLPFEFHTDGFYMCKLKKR